MPERLRDIIFMSVRNIGCGQNIKTRENELKTEKFEYREQSGRDKDRDLNTMYTSDK